MKRYIQFDYFKNDERNADIRLPMSAQVLPCIFGNLNTFL